MSQRTCFNMIKRNQKNENMPLLFHPYINFISQMHSDLPCNSKVSNLRSVKKQNDSINNSIQCINMHLDVRNGCFFFLSRSTYLNTYPVEGCSNWLKLSSSFTRLYPTFHYIWIQIVEYIFSVERRKQFWMHKNFLFYILLSQYHLRINLQTRETGKTNLVLLDYKNIIKLFDKCFKRRIFFNTFYKFSEFF